MTETEKDIKALDNAIDAMEKIKKVIAYCKKEIGKVDESDYGAGIMDACDNVLEILEVEI
jgi:aspartate ammonia-lyase